MVGKTYEITNTRNLEKNTLYFLMWFLLYMFLTPKIIFGKH